MKTLEDYQKEIDNIEAILKSADDLIHNIKSLWLFQTYSIKRGTEFHYNNGHDDFYGRIESIDFWHEFKPSMRYSTKLKTGKYGKRINYLPFAPECITVL